MSSDPGAVLQAPAGASTRDRIVEAALRLFYDQGFEATSLRQVAEEAGVHGGSVYHLFRTKADLLEGVLERYLELLDPVILDPVRAAGADPLERVFRLLAGYRENLIATEFSRGCPIGGLALEIAESQPRARELVVRNFEAWRDGVAGMLAEADLRPGVDPGEVAAFVLTVMEGAVMQAKSYRSVEPFDACVRQLRGYLEGVRAEGGGR